MNAKLKHDSDESPYEKVATNLVQTFHAPNTAGVLAHILGVHAFASLEIASLGIPLPNIRLSWEPIAKLWVDEQLSHVESIFGME